MTKTYELNLNKPSSFTPAISINFSKIIALVIAISYGSGLWLNIQHELEGAHEAKELQPVLHWLRDSTLSIIPIFFSILMALAFSRWLIQRTHGRMPHRAQLTIITICVGVFTGIAFAIGIPVHGYIFGANIAEGTNLVNDMLKDGSSTALISMGWTTLMIFVMNGLE